jgi:hypothetical protein
LQVSLQSCQLSTLTSLQVQEVSYSVCKEKRIASQGIAKYSLQACLQNHFAECRKIVDTALMNQTPKKKKIWQT